MSELIVGTLGNDSEIRARVAALKAVAILDTPPEDAFDALVRVAALLCDMPIAIVSLLDGDRLWFKAITGLSASTIPSENSFCKFASTTKKLLSVPDARGDPRFAANGLVAGELQVQAYIGAPIFLDGVGVGTICALDRITHQVPERASTGLIDLAKIASALLTARIEAFKLFTQTDALRPAGPVA